MWEIKKKKLDYYNVIHTKCPTKDNYFWTIYASGGDEITSAHPLHCKFCKEPYPEEIIFQLRLLLST